MAIEKPMTKQSAGDASIVVAAGGAVTVTSGLSMSEAKELFRLMLHESLAGLQAEAMEVAEKRNEKLLDDLLAAAQERFGASIEEKLSEFRDPGAQYAFRNAQTEFCKYGNEDSEKDAIELIISRISEANDIGEKIIYDEAIRICSRLSKRQIDFTCFVMLMYVVRFGAVLNVEKLNALYKQAEKYIDGLNCSTSDLSMLSYSGIMHPHVGGGHYNPLSGIVRSSYEGLMFKGVEQSAYNLPGALERGFLVLNVRSIGMAQPNNMKISDWLEILASTGYNEDQVAQAKATAEGNLYTNEEIFDQIVAVAPKFAEFRQMLESPSDGILSYQLSPVGRAIGVARTRQDKWYPDLKLSQII